ncbi:MAG: aldehyde dehydrogenase family protein, partial [Candidatus Electryonea clarkiae]|nr:aldehyde dehydrogenase family protein [Candidatus Electryonea clarkiae]
MSLMPFKNEAFTDFTDEKNKAAFEEALAKVKSEFGKHWDLLIDGERIKTENVIKSIDPADPDTVVGTVGKATKEIADKAVNSAYDVFENYWRWTEPEFRARILLKAA